MQYRLKDGRMAIDEEEMLKIAMNELGISRAEAKKILSGFKQGHDPVPENLADDADIIQ